jgi:hypothetical protein
MKDERDPKEQKQTEKAPALELKRREFLKTLGLVGGGLLAYSTPVVQASALGADAQGTNAVRMFDVATPAKYSINEERLTLSISVDGRAFPVDFRAFGGIGLGKTTDPDVSRVQIASLRLESIDENPLQSAGLDTGRIYASIPANTDIGHLNHQSGKLSENNFPISITYAKNTGGPINSTVSPSNPVISERAAAQKKCTKKNDVTVPVTPRTNALGTILLGMTPTTVSSGGTPVGEA